MRVEGTQEAHPEAPDSCRQLRPCARATSLCLSPRVQEAPACRTAAAAAAAITLLLVPLRMALLPVIELLAPPPLRGSSQDTLLPMVGQQDPVFGFLRGGT